MIAYFDTSAFLKLVISEPGSDTVAEAWMGATSVVAGRLLYPEARAALAAAHRARRIPVIQYARLRTRLDDLWADCAVVEVVAVVATAAGDVAEEHRLRGYDAVHLTSALHVAADVLVCADGDLLQAARARGLAVVDARTD